MALLKSFPWKKGILFFFLLYLLGLFLWLIHYDEDSIRHNLDFHKMNSSLETGLFVGSEGSLSLHLWPEIGFSGQGLQVNYLREGKIISHLEAKHFFAALNPWRLLLGQMVLESLELEDGKLTIEDSSFFQRFLEESNPLALSQIQAKQLTIALPESKEPLYLFDGKLKIYSDRDRYEAYLDVSYKNKYIHFDFESDAISNLLFISPERPWNLHLRFKMMGSSVEWVGILKTPLLSQCDNGRYDLVWPEAAFEVVFVGGDLSVYNYFFPDLSFPALGPYQLSFELDGRDKGRHYLFKNIYFQLNNKSYKGNGSWMRAPEENFILELRSALDLDGSDNFIIIEEENFKLLIKDFFKLSSHLPA